MVKESTTKLYNEPVKEEFLSQYDGSTYDQYRWALCRAYETEDFLDRDLYTFTVEEVEDALKNAKHTTKNAIRHTFNVFNKYMTWAAEKTYSQSNIDIIQRIINDKDLGEFLKKDKLYFSEEEIMNLIDGKGEYQGVGLVNYQDIAVILGIFEGITGNGLSELVNLTISDLRNIQGNILTVHDDKYGDRQLQISDKLIEYMYKANDQDIYENKNGTSEGRNTRSNLVMNQFIVKTVDRRTDKQFERADKHTCYRRIKSIADLFEIHNFNAINIKKSGMIKWAKDLYVRDGKLDNEQLIEVAKQFGVSSINVNGKETYNFSLLRDFINMENIEELYEM